MAPRRVLGGVREQLPQLKVREEGAGLGERMGEIKGELGKKLSHILHTTTLHCTGLLYRISLRAGIPEHYTRSFMHVAGYLHDAIMLLS